MKYTLEQLQQLMNNQSDIIIGGIDLMIKDDLDNSKLYTDKIRAENTKEDINAIFSDLIELENE